MALDLSELNNLDFNEIGDWPVAIKALALAVLCAAILAGGYFFHVKDQLARLDQVRQEEGRLKQDFESKQRQAASLPALQQQMRDMEESFGTMLRQLPSRTEVDSLLVDITQTGLAAGLRFELFDPQREQPREFYAELPIYLTVEGNFHQFGQFVSEVAALPRIVTLHDIAITQASGQSGQRRGSERQGLVMKATAKTYRYLSEQEIAERQAAARAATRGRR